MKVVRQTLAGTSTSFDFTAKGCKYLVKNNTDGDILVNFEAITQDNEATSIKIPKGTAQVVFTDDVYPQYFDKVYAKGTGEVEVQQLCIWG